MPQHGVPGVSGPSGHGEPTAPSVIAAVAVSAVWPGTLMAQTRVSCRLVRPVLEVLPAALDRLRAARSCGWGSAHGCPARARGGVVRRVDQSGTIAVDALSSYWPR
jgi:hypothetical protein